MAHQPAVFVDRDGVLNHLVRDPKSGFAESPLRAADVAIVAGAAKAICRLRAAGWLVICVTNQPAAAKGSVDLSTLREIHERVRSLLASEGGHFDGERICLHHPEGIVAELTGVCKCRKPEPGMLLDSAAEYGVDLSRSWMIGDTDADMKAGRAAGVRTVLVTADGSEHKRFGEVESDLVVVDIGDGVNAILANEPVGDRGCD
jgi:D-glycero-D-manno-heptose 1,7-bisphosphate phosphatase